jgi:hypothetical protein
MDGDAGAEAVGVPTASQSDGGLADRTAHLHAHAKATGVPNASQSGGGLAGRTAQLPGDDTSSRSIALLLHNMEQKTKLSEARAKEEAAELTQRLAALRKALGGSEDPGET